MKARVDVTDGQLTLESGRTRVRFAQEEGTFSVSSGRWRPIESAVTGVELQDGRLLSGSHWHPDGQPRRIDDAHGPGVRAAFLSEGVSGLRLRLELCAYDEQPFVLVRIGIENGGSQPERVRRFLPLSTANATFLRGPNARVFRHGWQSWSPSLSLSNAQHDIDVLPPMHAPADTPHERGAFASDEVAVLLDPEVDRSIVLGFATAHAQWAQIRVRAAQREIEAVTFTDGAPLRPGETLWSERLLIDLEGTAHDGLTRYAEVLGREMAARVPKRVPTGWCSWYYYYQNVSERDVLDNLSFVSEHRASLPFECVQVDDGYQANIGDWTTANDNFPRGMAALAHDINRAGFTPGLWLAPFLAGETSHLYAEHPEWVIRDDSGEPTSALWNWQQANYGLDCTHPGVEEWLHDLFNTVTNEWGYDYVKIDFLYAGALAGQRHDPDASRIEAYRRGLRAIRSAVGERFVLGCGAPMGPSVGLVDGMRIGPDVAPWWRFNRPLPRRPGRPPVNGAPSTENALRNALSRAWMHGRLWANDPDCLLVRKNRTKLTMPEVQSLATAIALSGGMVLASDDLTRLSQERIEIMSLLLPPLGDAADVPGLLEESMPPLIKSSVSRPFESWRLAGAFNWERRRRTMRVPLPPGWWHVFELWEQHYHGMHERHVELPDVPSHGARLLALRRALPRPQLVASTFHYSMGGAELENVSYNGRQKTLRVQLRPVAKENGEIVLHAPRGFRLVGAQLDDEPVEPMREGRLLRFAFDLTQPRELRARFR